MERKKCVVPKFFFELRKKGGAFCYVWISQARNYASRVYSYGSNHHNAIRFRLLNAACVQRQGSCCGGGHASHPVLGMTAAIDTKAHIRIWWVPIPRKSSGSDIRNCYVSPRIWLAIITRAILFLEPGSIEARPLSFTWCKNPMGAVYSVCH